MAITQQELDAIEVKKRLQDPSFGDGSMLMRPEDTSIQGASEDFMKYLQNPTDKMVPENIQDTQSLGPISKEFQVPNFDSPEAPVIAPQNIGTSMKGSVSGSSKGGSASSDTPPVALPQEDILAQLKAARDANAASLAGARQSDKMTELSNLIMKSGAMAGEGIVNQSGNTKIKLDPVQSVADETKFAGESAKSKLEALMQDYGLKKGMDDTAYNRKKDETDRLDKLAESKFDREYKNKMLEAAQNKAKSDKKEVDNAGQKELDKKFAKEYQDWTSGDKESSDSSIKKIENVITRMETGEGTTGGVSGLIPWDRITNKDLLANESDVQSEAVKIIKKVLSGATSDKDVERITKTLWNRDDANENNVARLKRFVEDAKAETLAKDEKAKYFQQNESTLKGYKKNLSPESKTITNKQYSPSRNQTRVTYSDGSTEIIDGNK